MPNSWFFTPKYDSLNIKSIYSRFGSGKKLKTYPLLNIGEYIQYRYFQNTKIISLLNYIDYDKKSALDLLTKKIDWKDYGGKHYESRIAILPNLYFTK